MGVCLSTKTKTGLNSKNVSAYAKDLSNPSSKVIKELSSTISKVSEVSVPQTLQSEGEILHPSNLKSFSLTELTAATRNFRKDSVLGEGGLGSVFKGWIDDHSLSATKPGTGIVVAVKRLSQDSFQCHEEWLHYNAKLADLGLSMEAPTRDKSRVSSRVMGTYGYAAPEYLATGHVSAKSDVFSFGVVLLELLSGRRAVDKNRPSGQHNLVEWAKPYMANKRKLLRVLDNRLEGQYDIDEAFKVATLCLRCLATESKLRPNMDEVVTDLEHLQVPHVHHNRSVNTSRSRRKSADDLTNGRSAKASLSPLSHDIANTRP
ncbi:hypothetical protein LR48_Vigan238s002600 [Vigna angularis]|uniref:Protein kinase domain-containing protein n=1 Tax=Phaseolus angularis TaxID=3914 RepID=A0A0L9T6I4_PHAAN|nr:hypothetical protein LR48_Vigan238s002600 [Vigna angularis]